MTNKPKIDPLVIISAFEQVDQMMANFAPIVGTYWKALCDAGVPYSLAEDLLRDWHLEFWEKNISGPSGD
jgi:hypothetical protein